MSATTRKVITKEDYVIRRLSKLRNKRWELYVVSGILHALNYPDIAFTTQQAVRLKNGTKTITDMYFPQFDIHVEVDEPYHETTAQTEGGQRHTEDIVDVTGGHAVLRVKVANKTLSSISQDD